MVYTPWSVRGLNTALTCQGLLMDYIRTYKDDPRTERIKIFLMRPIT